MVIVHRHSPYQPCSDLCGSGSSSHSVAQVDLDDVVAMRNSMHEKADQYYQKFKGGKRENDRQDWLRLTHMVDGVDTTLSLLGLAGKSIN